MKIPEATPRSVLCGSVGERKRIAMLTLLAANPNAVVLNPRPWT
jgi:hypothetical protein